MGDACISKILGCGENRGIEKKPAVREGGWRPVRQRGMEKKEKKEKESKMEADVCRARSRGDCLDVP